MVRMSGLSRWFRCIYDNNPKWTKEGMPTMVIDGVTLYDKEQ